MKFFVDTADVSEIRELAATGLLDGVTTNPSLVAKAKRDFKEIIAEICEAVPGPVSAEVAATDLEGMLRCFAGESIELTVKRAEDLHPVLADRGQMERLVVNLVMNARDAMPEGGALVIRTANCDHPATKNTGRHVALEPPGRLRRGLGFLSRARHLLVLLGKTH